MPMPEGALPVDLLARGSLRGKEYAWPIEAIPEVIEQAKIHDLISIGGQLQFRCADGAICECYWVEVDTHRTVSADLPWRERVVRTAEAAAASFAAIGSKYDFLAEGRKAFSKLFGEYESKGDHPKTAMCFVWYVTAEGDDPSEA